MTSDPCADDVREQLERILAADLFATAARHARLLRYLVERTLAGEGGQLKEYVLGTDVFDRDVSFDPRLDTIVRVEVRRLRNRLEDYYRGAGTRDPILITIPRGAYVPEFGWAGTPQTAQVVIGGGQEVGAPGELEARAPIPATGDVATQTRGRPAVWLSAAALILVPVGLLLAWTLGRVAPTQASTGPALAVLPFETFSAHQPDALLAARLTDTVTAELVRLGTVSVASRTSAWRYTGERRPAGEIAAALNVTLLVEASVEPTASGVHLTVRLVDAARDRKVWFREFEGRVSDVRTLSRRIAVDTAAAALGYHAR